MAVAVLVMAVHHHLHPSALEPAACQVRFAADAKTWEQSVSAQVFATDCAVSPEVQRNDQITGFIAEISLDEQTRYYYGSVQTYKEDSASTGRRIDRVEVRPRFERHAYIV
jgi:hypothetical protein